MLVLSSEQIRHWDAYTIRDQQITSLDLMERAVSRCMEWLETNDYLNRSFAVYCGKGNNGADGLVLARMLHNRHCAVSVFIMEQGHAGSADFQANLERLQKSGVEYTSLNHPEQLTPVAAGAVVVDALFGSGLNRPPDELTSSIIKHLNASGNEIIAIDIPSGMFSDSSSKANAVVQASHTLTFQTWKLAFLLAENERFFGDVHLLDIGLSATFTQTIEPSMLLVDPPIIAGIYQPRKSFSHKGTYGHALVVAGSYGKMGAAILATKACLHTGVGLLTCFIPACGYVVMQVSVPEAMAMTDTAGNQITRVLADPAKFNVLGIGPGLGTDATTVKALEELLPRLTYPVVLDADALNIISENKYLFEKIPAFSILTPHPKEFDRLFGDSGNDFERLQKAVEKAAELKLIIVLKGHHTFVSMPGGKGYFNSTGNAGMATGGSGDVLTGILTSLLAQKYAPEHAALLGVYLHGLAGDCAAALRSQEALSASDIIEHLGEAFLKINGLI